MSAGPRDGASAIGSGSRIPVAIFITSFDAGGTERQMTELVRRLDRRRFAVHVACFRREGAWLPRVESVVDSLVAFPISGFGRLSTWRQVRAFGAWCRERRIQVVHTCDFYANVFGLPAAAWARVPVRIGSRRDLNPGRTAAQLALQRAAYAAADLIVANSRAAAERLASEGVPGGRVRVIPNGVDLARFATREAREGPIRRVVTVANLRPEKAHEVLVDAAARLAAAYTDVEYVFVGEGPCRESLTALIRARGLERQVSLVGHREDVPALLAGADLYVLPSRTEAFPNGIIEAMAAGLPVVACGVGGMLELVTPGRTGELVAPDDPEGLASALRKLFDAPQRAREMGAAGRREVETRFSFDRMVQAFEALYVASLGGRLTGTAAPPIAAA